MRRYLYNGEWLDAEEYAFRKAVPSQLRSHYPCPRIIGDSMEPVQSMADGKVYTSKAAIRQSYRADGNPQGVAYTEVGNDPAFYRRERPQPASDPRAIRDALKRADSKLRLTS